MTLWIITGERGSGKTTFCTEFVRMAQLESWDAAGILSPAIFREDQKIAISARDIRGGTHRILAALTRRNASDLEFGEWFFNRVALDWGNEVIRASVPCDLLVIDELGPLEFNLKVGWLSALDVVKTGKFSLALVVIRPELLETARELLHPDEMILLQGEKLNASSLARAYAVRLRKIRGDS